MNIGTLTGSIVLADQLSGQLDIVYRHVQDFGRKFDRALGVPIAASATLAAVAITGITSAIVAMGVAGDATEDVAKGFDRLAGSAKNAEEIMASMRKGVAGTVTDLRLMTEANKLLQSGVKANATDLGTLTAVSRVLSKEGFGPLETIMAQVNRAMETGQTARLGRIGLTVNVKKAEEDLAKSLNTTRDGLSDLGRLEARRIGLLEASRSVVASAGVQERSFSDRIDQTRVSIQNWFIELNRRVGISSHLTAAFDSIEAAIQKAFGGTSKTLLEFALDWINRFADAVGRYVPIAIQWMIDIKNKVVDIYEKVKEAWHLVPDWFKRIAEESALAGAGVIILDKALGGLHALETLAALAHISEIWHTWSGVIATKLIPNIVTLTTRIWALVASEYAAGVAAGGMAEGFIAAGAAALGAIGSLFGPIGWTIIGVTALLAVLYKFDLLKPTWEFIKSLAATIGHELVSAFKMAKDAMIDLADNGFVKLAVGLAKLSWATFLADLRLVSNLAGSTLSILSSLASVVYDLVGALIRLEDPLAQARTGFKAWFDLFKLGELGEFIELVKWTERMASAMAAIARVTARQISGGTPRLLENIAPPVPPGMVAGVSGTAEQISAAARATVAPPGSLTEPTDAQKAHAKAVKELLEALRGASKETDVFHDAFKQLTATELQNANVTSQLIPLYLKAVAARQQMTAAESAGFAQALRNREAEKLKQEQSLLFRHITLETINALKLRGESEEEIAAQFYVSENALKDYEDRLEFSRDKQQDLTKVVNKSSAVFAMHKEYIALATQEQREFNAAKLAGIPALDNYDSALLRANEAQGMAARGEQIQAQGDLAAAQVKAQTDGLERLAASQLKYDQIRGASARVIFADSQRLAQVQYENAKKLENQRFSALDASKTGYAEQKTAHKIALDQMDADFIASNNLRIAEFERSQSKFYQMIDSIKSRFKSLGEDISSNLGTLFFGLGNDVDGSLHAAASRAHDAYVQIAADGKHTASELANAFRAWHDAEDAANSTFAERFKEVMYSIKKTFIDVFNDILKYFVESFLVGLVKGMAGAKLGQQLGGFLMGGGGGGGGGTGVLMNAGTSAGLSALLSGGGGATAASVLASGGMVAGGTTAGIAAGTGTLAASGPGFGAVAAGGGTGAGAGAGGSTLVALASNPITWGVAAGLILAWGITKKGWFRGGEEGVQVNPARDKFLTQNFAKYDPPDIHDPRNPAGFHGLSALLTATHGQGLFSALTSAHSMKAFRSAEQAIAMHLGGRHIGPGGKELPRITSLKLFEQGGFVQPGETRFAELHGGGMGEIAAPVDTLAAMMAKAMEANPTKGKVGGAVHQHLWQIHIHGGVMDKNNVKDVWKEHIIPLFKQSAFLNEDGLGDSIARAAG